MPRGEGAGAVSPCFHSSLKYYSLAAASRVKAVVSAFLASSSFSISSCGL